MARIFAIPTKQSTPEGVMKGLILGDRFFPVSDEIYDAVTIGGYRAEMVGMHLFGLPFTSGFDVRLRLIKTGRGTDELKGEKSKPECTPDMDLP